MHVLIDVGKTATKTETKAATTTATEAATQAATTTATQAATKATAKAATKTATKTATEAAKPPTITHRGPAKRRTAPLHTPTTTRGHRGGRIPQASRTPKGSDCLRERGAVAVSEQGQGSRVSPS